MSPTLATARGLLAPGRSYVPSHDQAGAQAAQYGIGPRTRVRLAGDADEPAVRTALTRAWRAAGQPLTVVVLAHGGRVDQVAAAWAAEHAVAGIRLVVRNTVTAASPPAQVLHLEEPATGACPACGRAT